MDEAGTPFCATVDGLSVGEGPEQGTVTLRARDSKAQERVPASELATRLGAALRLPWPTPP
jgi:glycyl-tRNA synthetase (class II)